MPRSGEVISHWHHFVEDFNTSTLDFYRSVEQTLVAKESPVKPTRVDWAESGVLSARREYLRATYGRYSFDIAAFPFGKDFFFSWWLSRRRGENTLMIGCMSVVGALAVLMIFVKLMGYIVGTIVFVIVLAAVFAALRESSPDTALLVEDVMLSIPGVSSVYRRYFKPVTYFSEDTRLVFQESVHKIFVRHIEAALSVAKLPPLSPEQSKVRISDPVT